MTVFIVARAGRVDEVSICREYGDVYYINDRFVYADEIEEQRLPLEFLQKIEYAASIFDPEHDYLLIGSDYLQLLAMATELSRRYGKFRVLRYDNKADGHLPISVGTVHSLTPAA